MKITLVQQEIEQALKEYISNQGITIKDRDIEIDITAGRGPNGVSATLDIIPAAKTDKVDSVSPDMGKKPRTTSEEANTSPDIQEHTKKKNPLADASEKKSKPEEEPEEVSASSVPRSGLFGSK